MSRQTRFRAARPRRPLMALGVALATVAAVLAGLAEPAVAAESCLDQVRDLASQHGAPSKPPTAAPDSRGRVTTHDLSRSGGVIAPPPTDDKSVITPPSTGNDSMPTVPDVGPQAQQQDTPAANRTKLQAALTAARAQAERGDEKGCQEALARARTLAERTQ